MPETTLIELTDDDLAAMLRGDARIRDRMGVPPGGVDDPLVLEHVRSIFGALRKDGYVGGHWMIVADGEVVGLCGIKHPPSTNGEVEIGYGIAASRRRRGHATRAIGLVVAAARGDAAIRFIAAETAVDNVASQRALQKNGFERSGARFDPTDGDLVIWRKQLTTDWEQRLARLWETIDDYEPDTFRAKVENIAAELPAGDPIAPFEVASANDSTGRPEHAAPLYREALATGLSGLRRRRAVIQLASTLRNLGKPHESVELLTAEREAHSDELDDALIAFLSLALIDTGREREAAALALSALSRHLPRYNRSLANYAADLMGRLRAHPPA